jgi:hypothetical protein
MVDPVDEQISSDAIALAQLIYDIFQEKKLLNQKAIKSSNSSV